MSQGRQHHPGRGAVPVNNRIRELRTQRRWSQEQLAVALEVSRQTVNAIENGRYDPSLPLAFKLAAVFGLPIEQLFSPGPSSSPSPPAATGFSVPTT